MKKALLFVFMNCSCAFAQDIPNAGFEYWSTFDTYELPVTTGADFASSNSEIFFSRGQVSGITNVNKVPGVTGSAIRVETVTSEYDTVGGYFLYSKAPNGDPPVFPGGLKFSDGNITGVNMKLRYKAGPSSPAFVLVKFKKNGIPVGPDFGNGAGTFIFQFSGNRNTFFDTTFSFSGEDNLPVSTVLEGAAFDTIVLGVASNFLFGPIKIPGDFAEIDDLNFAGSSEPIPGGDFDTWALMPPVELPDAWRIPIEPRIPNIYRKSTDRVEGSFALEINNIIVNPESDPDTMGVTASCGWIDWSGPNPDYHPGIRMDSVPHSLGFYYRYNTAEVDTAVAWVLFTKYYPLQDSTANVGESMVYLLPNSSYEYLSMPIYPPLVMPDSAIINITSSKDWGSGNRPQAGSSLTIDDLRFNYCNAELSIEGAINVCDGDTKIYRVDHYNGSDYSWSTPPNATIIGGDGTNEVEVDFSGAQDGLLMVTKSFVDGCPDKNAELAIAVKSRPLANAGADQLVCENELILLNGTVSGVIGGIWTGGTGTFSPDRNTLNASYAPSASEISSGSVVLTLNADNGACLESDEVLLTIESCTGLFGEEFAPALLLSPNPTNGVFSVYGITGANIIVRNIMSEIVFETQSPSAGHSVQIDLSAQPGGTYSVLITNGRSSISTLLIKL